MILKHNFHKLQNKSNIRTKELSFDKQIDKFGKLYSSKFQVFYKEQINDYKVCGLTNAEEVWHAKSVDKLNFKFKLFLEICTVIKQQKWTINQYFKLVSKPLMPRSAFFAFKGQLCKMCDTYTLNFNRYLNKTTKPNNIQYKYSGWLRWKVCEFCFKCIEKKEYYDYTSIWLEIRKSEILAKYGDFSTLNLKTFMKIISSDPRYRKKAVKPYEPKHPIRTRIQQLAIMQMDLKILGMR